MNIQDNTNLILTLSIVVPILVPLLVGHVKRLIPKLISIQNSYPEQYSCLVEEDPHLKKNPQHIITLIHGTFAKNADWILYNSYFCQMIRRKMQNEVAFIKFNWSGKNSINARLNASKYLREHIKNTASMYPRAKHTIIAHSHGGNILLDSIDNELIDKTNGFIFLSTPFLSFIRKEADPLLTTSMHWAPFFWILWLIIQFPELTETQITIVYTALIGLGVIWWKMIESFKKRYDQLLLKHDSRNTPFQKSLIVSPVADEANGILVTTGFFTWLCKTLLGYISRFLYPSHDLLEFTDNFFDKKYGNLITFTLLVFVAYIILYFILSLFDTAEKGNLLFDIFAIAVISTICSAPLLLASPFIIRIAYGFITAPIFFIIAFTNLSVGREMFILSLFGEVSIDKSPPGSARILQLNQSNKKGGTLAHSEPYTSEECIAQICKWLKQHDSLDREKVSA